MGIGIGICILVSALCITAAVAHKVPTQQAPDKELAAATSLVESWGFGAGMVFLEVADMEETADSVLLRPQQHKNAVAVAVRGPKAPTRRNVSGGEPFFQLSGFEGHRDAAQLLAVVAVNRGAGLLEAVTGRPLYPFRLVLTPFSNSTGGPWVVWNVSSGEVYFDARVMGEIARFPGQVSSAVGGAVEALFAQISRQPLQLSSLFSTAAPAAIAVGLGSQVPLWFCIACPVVLGLVAPFIFNAGLGMAASMLCQHYDLPAEECNDLWYGAFALAMVLSLASAIPIVYICQLSKCAKQS